MKNTHPKTRRGSPIFVSYLKRGLRFTTDKEIAISVAQETKRAPIEFISERLREAYLRAWPELGNRFE